MKHNLVNFTRGRQLLGHFGFRFAAGLKGPLLITLAVALGLGWWEVTASLSEHQVYLVWMYLYAAAYGFMEFDPAKLVHLNLGDGTIASFPMQVVRDYPPMRNAVTGLVTALRSALVHAALVLLPLFAAFWWFAERFGERSKQKNHVRGSLCLRDGCECRGSAADGRRHLGAHGCSDLVDPTKQLKWLL